MADILLDVQTEPSTPAANTAIVYVETVSKSLAYKDDAGMNYLLGVGALDNHSVASQGPGFATDTYLTGSNITIPASEIGRAHV